MLALSQPGFHHPRIIVDIIAWQDFRLRLREVSMSSTFGPAEAQAYIHKLLTVMHHQGGSDLFISSDFPPSMKHQGAMKPLSQQRLTGEVTRALALSLMNERQRLEFETEMECNFAISLPGVCRFRVNVFQ